MGIIVYTGLAPHAGSSCGTAPCTGLCHLAHRASHGSRTVTALIAMVGNAPTINTASTFSRQDFWTCGEPYGPDDMGLQAGFGLWARD